MPYRVKEGQEVMLLYLNDNLNVVQIKRTVDFELGEVIASPLDEHRTDNNIPGSPYTGYPWGFNVESKWSDGSDANRVKSMFVEEVHQVAITTDKQESTVVVPGSGTNTYTVELDTLGYPISCTCPSFRFHRSSCKHMDRVRNGEV